MINLDNICQKAIDELNDLQEIYIKEKLIEGSKNIIRESMNGEEIRDSIIQAALELTTEQEPKWQYVASKLYVYRLYDEVRKNRKINLEEKPYNNFYKFIKEMTDKNLYGKYILENYTEYEIEELEKMHNEAPEKRIAHKKLAEEVITFLHGHEEYEHALKISESLFSEKVTELSSDDIISSLSNLVILHIRQQIRGFPSFCRTFTAHITFLALYCSMLSICCSISFLHSSIFTSLWLGIFNLLLTA